LTERLELVFSQLEDFASVPSDLSFVYLGTAIGTKLRKPLKRHELVMMARQVLQEFGREEAHGYWREQPDLHKGLHHHLQTLLHQHFFAGPWFQLKQIDSRTLECEINRHPWLIEMMDGILLALHQSSSKPPATVRIDGETNARFLIQLPQAAEIVVPFSKTEQGLAKEKAQVNAMRVLVVDDDPDVRHFLHVVMEEMGWTVISVENGEQALATLYQDDFPLILLDSDMPQLDGNRTASYIRSTEDRRNWSSTFIIGMSANATVTARQRALNAGCDLFMAKPLDAHYLQTTLADHFHKQQPKQGVQVDPIIAPLLPHYLQRRANDISQMRTALRKKEIDTLLQYAHRIKGSGRSYGLFDLSEMASMLEIHLKAHDFSAAKLDLKEMSHFIMEAQNQYPLLDQAL
jgi:DNA-binding response OmpR family regulator